MEKDKLMVQERENNYEGELSISHVEMRASTQTRVSRHGSRHTSSKGTGVQGV